MTRRVINLGVGRRDGFTEQMDAWSRNLTPNLDNASQGEVDGPMICRDDNCPNASAIHTEDGCLD